MRLNPHADRLVAGTAVAVFLLTTMTIPDSPCTTADPCGAEPLTSLALSLLAAVAVMSFLHRWSAVWAAVLCAMVWPLAAVVEDSGLGWRAALPSALVAVAVAVARRRPQPPLIDSPAAVRRQAPTPRGSLTTDTMLSGALLVAVGVAGFAWTVWQQHRVTLQEAAADSISAVVRDRIDDGAAIVVELPDGKQWIMSVLFAPDYPIGGRVDLAVDDDGLRQLRSEPYDITVLFMPLSIVTGAGTALVARALPRSALAPAGQGR